MTPVLEDDSTTGSPRALIDRPGPQGLVVSGWAANSAQGRQRLRNEDAWAQLGPVFAISDGMGGLDHGHLASDLAVRHLANEWLRGTDESPEAIVRAANEQIIALAGGDECGCTLSAVRIAHDQATVVHVGDSRLYRVRDGQAEVLTRDHNLRSELLAAGIVPGTTSSFGPLRALTSHLGKPDHELQIDVRSVSLRRGDRLVLCTDGVFNELTHRDFADRTAVGRPSDVVAHLTGLRGRDDATALVVDIGVDE